MVNDKPWFRQQVKDLKNELAADNLTAVKARLETMLNTLIAPEEAADKQEVQHILNHLNSAIDQLGLIPAKDLQKERVLREISNNFDV